MCYFALYCALGNYIIINMILSPSHYVTLGYSYAMEMRLEKIRCALYCSLFAICRIDTDIAGETGN